MATRDLPQHYDPASAEARYRPQWEQAGYAKADPARPGKAFSVVLPPPNVTGSLHMGHALNGTLQDILARYRRMDGDNVAWTPGLDHASIAVHWLVEKELRAEGTDRRALGREKFLERAWAFKEKSAAAILRQQKRLALSCDWSRLCFTLDDGPSEAVREAFCRLYNDGLIYRAERLVNWDPVSQTTVSDLEVVHEENVRGTLYHFAYPLAEPEGEVAELVVATTRPETMLGDTAVAVHPDDPRFRHLIGKTLRHPFSGQTLPIVGDATLVDVAFGTGAVKITPAHDFNDFAVGERHKLAVRNILNKDGTLSAACGEFAGLDVVKARKAVMEKLEAMGLARGEQPHRMSLGRSERSGAVVEPMLSTQWYVRAKPLARPAMAAVERKFTQFVPQTWENTYFSWLRDIRDWCISRQLWWGHRIPAYYCEACAHVHVATCAPEACETCGHKALRQDEDVLDTWFSSALWPFSTQGWPHADPYLARYYPTQTLVTSFDIIFFWVARMMMFGLYFTGNVPFADVYIHALIRDSKGEKMSKTKGNVVDPLVMCERYGLDAFRFTLAAFAGQGRDVRWDERRAEGYGKFINKIWQAFRFTCAQLPEGAASVPAAEALSFAPFDLWLRARADEAVRATRAALDAYKFDQAAAAIYHFVWDELCDWYLEVAKTILYDETAAEGSKQAVRRSLLDAFGTLARLLHPFTPYFAEELYQELKTRDAAFSAGAGAADSVMVAPFPKVGTEAADAAQRAALAEAEFVAEVVTALRRIRAEFGVNPKQVVDVQLRPATDAQAHQARGGARILQILAKSTLSIVQDDAPVPPQAATDVCMGATLYVPLAGVIDVAAEQARLEKNVAKCTTDLGRIEAQLQRPDFVDRAPPAVVADKRAQAEALRQQRAELTAALARLAG